MTAPIPDYRREAKREDRRWSAIGFLAVIAALQALVIGVLVLQVHDETIRSREQSEQLAQLIAADEQRRSQSDERLDQAVAEVGAVMEELFAEHHEDTGLKLNDTLGRIAALLDRPAGIPVDPVSATDVDPATSSPRSPREAQQPRHPAAEPPSTTTTTTPPSTTTTTSPGQSGLCERIPTAFPCRSSR